ncbi:Sec-independent protein translocase subunit TatA [Nesterenkonia massiliensis]|uniref:Sec-independent protein translocase subunit TatA n=1 Tax=Nesterenkonia massiliensis TaxID=1232429 RepID=UPI0004186E1E|nr:Sec-independent protein translocase subunit TatA [Nesterenkonia massiliensis]
MGLQGWQWVLIALIILLLFGAPKLPKLAKSMGESMRIFKSEVKTMREEDSKNEQESDRAAVEGRVIDPTVDVQGDRTKHKDQR